MTDASGTVVARYDYDPWGRSTTVIGTNKPDFNFTGLYNHAKSGLDMAVYRFYDPDLGRWICRDPLKDAEILEGPNLYAYVLNEPLIFVDPSGEGLWKAFKCYLIVRKWQRDCFSKVPHCDKPCGGSVEDQLLGTLACMKERDEKLKNCLEGMNRDLFQAGCETMSIGAPPGYFRPPFVP